MKKLSVTSVELHEEILTCWVVSAAWTRGFGARQREKEVPGINLSVQVYGKNQDHTAIGRLVFIHDWTVILFEYRIVVVDVQ